MQQILARLNIVEMQIDVRRRRLLGTMGAIASGLASWSVLAAQMPKGTEGTMAPGPDIEAAVRSEYDRAAKKGTRQSYERFIRRHPAHPLAEKAREALAKGELK